jgi:hypothetical protein
MSVSRDAATAREPGADLLAAPSKTVDASDQLSDTGHVSRLGAATGDGR